jgi:hypothetical protein
MTARVRTPDFFTLPESTSKTMECDIIDHDKVQLIAKYKNFEFKILIINYK